MPRTLALMRASQVCCNEWVVKMKIMSFLVVFLVVHSGLGATSRAMQGGMHATCPYSLVRVPQVGCNGC